MDTESQRLYDELTPIIDEELRVAFALRRFGEIETPPPDSIATVANLVADEVVRYLARRPPLPDR